MKQKKEETQKEIIFQEKPEICLIDIKNDIKDNLVAKGFNVKSGTLGKLINVSKKNLHSEHQCLLNYSFPENLHEYEIIVLDLSDNEKIEYNEEQNSRKYVIGNSASYILSQYPENLFNPKPFGSHLLSSQIAENNSQPVILIIFVDKSETVNYNLVTIKNNDSSLKRVTYNNYDFYPDGLHITNKIGKELIVQQESYKYGFYDFLNKYIEEATYFVTFNIPKYNFSGEFVPLIKNSHNEIVSFFRSFGNYIIFVFPQIVDKSSFLYELLTNQLPTLCPEFFPYNTEFKWLEEEHYLLPNAENLLGEKEALIKEYEEKIERKNEEIEANHKNYGLW